MRTETITVRSDGYGLEEMLFVAEEAAEAEQLSRRDSIHLRLLAEEMRGMLQSIVGKVEVKFWIEEEDGIFQLHIYADARLYKNQIRELLSVSTTGRNEAVKGVLGKIRSVFAAAFWPEDEYVAEAQKYALGLVQPDSRTPNLPVNSGTYWSLNQYRSRVEGRKDSDFRANEAWDELEKSVIANLASEVRIGIKGNHVDMVVYMEKSE